MKPISRGALAGLAIATWTGGAAAVAQDAEPCRFTGDWFAMSLAQVDDLDCDGLRDFAVGMPHSRTAETLWEPFARVFVYSARTGTLIHELATASLDSIGYDVRAVPDLDGDGMGEVVSGRSVFSGFTGAELLAPRPHPDSGDVPRSSDPLHPWRVPVDPESEAAMHLLFWSPAAADRSVRASAFAHVRPHVDVMGRVDWPWSVHAPPQVVTEPGLTLAIDSAPLSRWTIGRVAVLRSPRTPGELVLTGDRPLLDLSGKAAWIGDVDRDGCPDFALADLGLVRVHSGRTGERLRSIESPAHAGGFGESLAGGSDLDGDGVPDLLVGTIGILDGCIEAFSGASGRLISRIEGNGMFVYLGASVAFLDDLDGDRVPEILGGSLWLAAEEDWGAAFVYSGRTKEILLRVSNPHGHYGSW